MTIERPAAPPPAAPEPPAPPPEPPAAPKEVAAQAPTLESALAEPEPPPDLGLRDFPKPVLPKPEQKKPSAQLEPAPAPKPAPQAAPNPDVNKAAPPAGEKPSNAVLPTPPPNQADAPPADKERNERLARLLGTRYLERMGIKPSHQATLTGTSGRACPLDPEPYKLEIADNKLTVTNNYGIMFSVAVPADGEIYQIFKRPPMAGDHVAVGKRMEYSMKGNLKSGKLEIWHLGCVYTLILEP